MVVKALALVAMIAGSVDCLAAKFQIVHSFNGEDGRFPGGETPLAKGPLGLIAGVTQLGGTYDEGALFVIDAADRFHLLHSFSSAKGEGVLPNSVMFSEDGGLLGTTGLGGINDAGTVFRVGPLGRLSTLYSFDYVTGNQPSGRFVCRDKSIYGSTGFGGDAGAGNIYKLSYDGTVSSLYSVSNRLSDSAGLYFGVVSASDGTLYGASMGYDVGDFNGTVYKFDMDGKYTILHTFAGGIDGSRPTSAPAVASDGTIYGATYGGGQYALGTIYRITPAGEYSVIYAFGDGDGLVNPFGGVIVGKNGNLYGTATGEGDGAIFELNTKTLQSRVLHVFDSSATYPQGGLVETTSGTFYGTTGGGGTYGLGTIYKLKLSRRNEM
jgi:uncharacterized repeat protein (TIGR03803 family)